MKTVARSFMFATMIVVGGCGSSSTPDGGTSVNPNGAFLPMTVGNTWIYQITEIDGTVSSKTQSITANELTGGVGDGKDVMSYKFVTGNKFADPNGDVSYQALVGTRYVRLRDRSIDGKTGNVKKEEYYSDPYKPRLDTADAHTVKGATWTESFTHFTLDTPKASASDGGATDAGAVDAGLVTTQAQDVETWTVVAVNESVTVPAGTFKALVLNRIVNATNKTFWFAKGVGKVKETGIADQTEELTKFEVAK